MAFTPKTLLTVAASMVFWAVTEGTLDKCDDKVIECIKRVNKGFYFKVLEAAGSLIWYKNWYIAHYSGHEIKKNNLTCVTTTFTALEGNTDCYHNSCTVRQPLIPFNTSLELSKGIFQINNYQDMNLSAFLVYRRKYCLALYVCSAVEGVKKPHMTIYCPCKKKDSDEVKVEIEEAKAKLTKCGINDGAPLCVDKCYACDV